MQKGMIVKSLTYGFEGLVIDIFQPLFEGQGDCVFVYFLIQAENNTFKLAEMDDLEAVLHYTKYA